MFGDLAAKVLGSPGSPNAPHIRGAGWGIVLHSAVGPAGGGGGGARQKARVLTRILQRTVIGKSAVKTHVIGFVYVRAQGEAILSCIASHISHHMEHPFQLKRLPPCLSDFRNSRIEEPLLQGLLGCDLEKKTAVCWSEKLHKCSLRKAKTIPPNRKHFPKL